MKKVLLGLLLLSSVSVFAQGYDEDEKTFHVRLGGNLSLPLGDLKEGTSYGVGFEVEPSLMFTENIEGFALLGVDVFKGKSQYGYGEDANSLLHIPLMLGGRFKTNGFFAGAGVGYGLWKSSGASNNGLMYSPQIGYDAGKIEIAAHYSSTKVTGGSLSYFGIKVLRSL